MAYYLTAAFHFFAGLGIWGLHFLQNRPKNTLSAAGTVMISLSYLALAYLPIQVMHSGLSNLAFMEENPIYKIPAMINVVGMIVFGISVIRAKFFPAWTGVIIILGIIIFVVAMTNGFQIVANINNIVLSVAIIYMCILGFSQLQHGGAVTADFASDGKTEVLGTYVIDGSKITIRDTPEESPCYGKDGVYNFKHEGNTITITLLEDACEIRRRDRP